MTHAPGPCMKTVKEIMELADAYGSRRHVDGAHDCIDSHPMTFNARVVLESAIEDLAAVNADLLEALQRAIEFIDTRGEAEMDAYDAAVAAIAKATGETYE